MKSRGSRPAKQKQRANTETRAGDLPPLAERRCVIVGMATIGADGEPSYNHDAIKDAWFGHWTDANSSSFARHYDIPYRSLRRIIGPEEIEQKRQAIMGRASQHWQAIRAAAAIEEANTVVDQAKRFSTILSSLERTAAAGAKYAELRLVKIRNGVAEVMVGVSPAEVKAVMDVAYRAASTLHTIVEINRGIPAKADEDRDVEPKPIVAGRIGKKTA